MVGQENRNTDIQNKIVMGFLDEQRKSRIWGYVFKFSFLVYLFVTTYTYIFLFDKDVDVIEDKHVAVIDINGEIGSGSSVDYTTIVPSVKQAFESENSIAVVLNANSPGGSPAHSDIIYRELVHYKKLHPEKPLYLVVGDVCASGCYYIASAADEILVNRTSMLGNIGVKMQGFGYVELMERLGVERRGLAAGEHKTLMDPFSKRDQFAEKHLVDSVLVKTHDRFIEVVKEGRGERLSKDEDLFSGLVWSGDDAIEIGLADRVGSIYDIVRDIDDVEDQAIYNYSRRNFNFKEFIFGASMAVIEAVSATGDSKIEYRM